MSLRSWINVRFPKELILGERFYVPKNLNFWYVFGALLTFMLGLQFISGLWLTMFYHPTAANAFASVQYIMREVHYGWLIRGIHVVGASALFVLLYLHLLRGLIYRSYRAPREMVWLLGVVLFWFMLVEAFLGYLLPWGQMSYWGATVITNLLSILPHGDALVTWIRGDYQVSGVTLTRFYALHIVLLPLLILYVIRLHIKALHHVGSGNPAQQAIDTRSINDKVPAQCQSFFPLQALKDGIAILIFLMFFAAALFFVPHLFNEPLNYLPADSMQTPNDIKPLWYMSAFYAMLRAVPSKAGGVLLLISSLTIWLVIPFLDRLAFKCHRWLHRVFILLMIASFVSLTYFGLQPVAPALMPWLLLLSFTYLGLLILTVLF